MTPEDVLSDPTASYWLKEAIRACLERDPLDAAADASVLANLMESRLAARVGQGRNLPNSQGVE